MRIGAFQVEEPLPELREPHALAILRPWIDVGSVGSMTVAVLENHFHAKPLAKLVKPGNFFDFTRYRPIVRLVEGQREVEIPNSFINHARPSEPGGNDFLIFHLLEPHMLGEDYVDSVLKVLQKLAIKRYCLIGSMYDVVPHTRPLIVSGSATGPVEGELRKLDVRPINYEGPTTIAILISQLAPRYNIEVMTLIVHLPQYVRLERDYAGTLRLMEVLCSLYHFPFALEELRNKAEKQSEEMNRAMERESQLREVVQQLEIHYDARVSEAEKEQPKLSPEIEEFLREVTRRFEQD